jgi:hypothetical protein
MSKSSFVSIFRRSNPDTPTSQKITYTLNPDSTVATTTFTCTTSATLPSYHIPSSLTTKLLSITLSSTDTGDGSCLPRYREVYKIQRLPFVGYQLTGNPRAQVHVSGNRHKSEVHLYSSVDGLVNGGEDRATMKLRKNVIIDSVTGKELATMFEYKTGGDKTLRALELADGVGDSEKRRDLIVGLWAIYLWNLELHARTAPGSLGKLI